MNLKGKTALITGATSEMAQAITAVLAQAQAKVVLTDQSKISTDQLFIKLDLAQDQSIRELDAFVIQNNLTIDVLVNVAAVGGTTFEKTTPDFFRQVLEINTLAAFKLSKFVAEILVKHQKPGSIINIATTHASTPNTDPAYSSSKAALLALTKSLALKLAPNQIRVNAVSPGAIAGGMNKGLTSVQVKKIQQEIPMGQFGEPVDMAQAVLFLASDAAGYITGQNLKVDGGLSLADSSYNR